MARVYATPEQLAVWLGGYPPVNAVVLLTRASLDVDTALIGAIYDTDDDLLPTDPAVVEALRDATIAQVASWPSEEMTAPTGARLTMVRPPPGRGLAEDAAAVLRGAGLLPIVPRVAG